MDERSGTIRLVDSRDSEARGLVTTISRSEVEKALHADEGVDLLLDVERAAAEGDGRETERIALAWEPADLERLLAASSADEITLTFDDAEIRRLLDEDVDAHGMRETLAAITVVAGLAAASAGGAAAMYPASEGGGAAVGTPSAVVAPASEISTGLGTQQSAAAPASEISTGLGDQSAPAEATLAVSDHGVLTAKDAGLGDTPAPAEASLASASEISTGLGDQSAPAEEILAASDHGVLTAKDAGLGDTSAPAEASRRACRGEPGVGVGDQHGRRRRDAGRPCRDLLRCRAGAACGSSRGDGRDRAASDRRTSLRKPGRLDVVAEPNGSGCDRRDDSRVDRRRLRAAHAAPPARYGVRRAQGSPGHPRAPFFDG